MKGQSFVDHRTAASQRSSGWIRVRLWIHKFQLFPSIHNSAVLPLCEQDWPAAVSGERSQRRRSLLNIPYPKMQQDSCETTRAVFGVFPINQCLVDRTDRKPGQNPRFFGCRFSLRIRNTSSSVLWLCVTVCPVGTSSSDSAPAK